MSTDSAGKRRAGRRAPLSRSPLPLQHARAGGAHHPLAVLGTVCLAAVTLPLSFAGAPVAIPAISHDLGGSPVALNWITNAFMLSFGSVLMAAGTLADVFGRKRIFAIGIALFVLLSLLIGLAPSVGWLDVLRAAQGVAGAAALSGGSAALAQEFDGDARTRAFSLLGTTFGVGLAFGPILAGCLIDRYGWRSIFVSSALIGALVLLFGVPRMRESRDPDAAGVDWTGTVAFTGFLATLTWGVLQAPESGWTSGLVVGLFALSAACAVAFFVIERWTARPMLDLTLFRYPRFVGVQALPVATCYCFVVLLILLPIRFIGIEGRSEVSGGLMMIALSAPLLFVPFAAALVTRWVRPAVVSGVGLLIAALGLYLLSRIEPGQSPRGTMLAMFVIGFGTGMPWGLMDGLSVSVVPKERAGMATGIFSTTRVAGEGIALAIVGALLAGLIQGGLAREPHLAAAAPSLAMAAQRAATGDLGDAAALVPGLSHARLIKVYADAFRMLLYALIAITLLSALIVFGLLAQPHRSADEA
ncbi:MFS transporter [Trinickia violacea]|uniref:MFS transporter n=1 Tax=Trinickia violacea TaxID=2571746 RepID=A0A4P8J1Y8_9BURK|nr:MFS transporter [Trinickia violacea]QCP54023.1 MFS transporter [Trinickia violacea]